MRTTRIYHPDPLTVQTTLTLTSVAAHHVRTVLRLKQNDPIQLFDGTGGQYRAVITACTPKSVQVFVETHEAIERESPLSIHLMQALLRGEKMDFVIQKATELGVSDITPLLTERCNVELKGERLEKKTMHWENIAIQACEQCGRNRIPKIHAPISLSAWMASHSGAITLICTPDHPSDPFTSQPTSCHILIGPEGGWAPEEIKTVINAGGHAFKIGPRILRTETAGLAAISVLQAQWGDFTHV